MSDNYRQDVQVTALNNYHAAGIGAELHPTPGLYGSGWGDPYTVPELQPVRQAITQEASHASKIVEIGCGGGRWTKVISEAKADGCHLLAVDATPAAFELTNAWLQANKLPTLDDTKLCPNGDLENFGQDADIVFSFDVFVHFEPELMHAYITSIAKILRPGGKFMVSLACAYDQLPGWVRSDQWFEYVMRARGDRIQYKHQLLFDLQRYFLEPTKADVYLIPAGMGSAFLQLTRSTEKHPSWSASSNAT